MEKRVTWSLAVVAGAAAVLSLSLVVHGSGVVSQAAGQTAARYVDSPDLGSLIKRVLTPQGMMDPDFGKAVAVSSPYLTDFFGVQAIKDVAKEEIRKHFVPKHATVVKEDEHGIELSFSAGYTGRFVSPASFAVVGTVSQTSHVYISGDTWPVLLKNVQAFRDLLKSEKLTDRYLIPNPHYQDEVTVENHLRTHTSPVELTLDPQAEAFGKATDAVMIYPDAVHGDEQGFAAFLTFVKTHKVDWLGLEAMPAFTQKDLDTYITAPDNSPQLAEATKSLTKQLADGWDKRFKDTSESHFMKVLAVMRQNKSRVYALEGVPLEYIIWRYGETPFGAAVRSLVWAKIAPTTGRGLIFGGSGHIASPTPWNIEDFLAVRNPKRSLFLAVKTGRYREK